MIYLFEFVLLIICYVVLKSLSIHIILLASVL